MEVKILTINQLTTLLIFFLTGVIIGFVFDFFRILRRSFKTSDIVTYIQDFMFWICTGAILLFSIFKFNNGELRGYIFIGTIFGVIAYMLFLSKHLINLFTKILIFLKKILSYPFKVIFNFVKKHIYTPIQKIVKNIPKFTLKNKKKDNLSNKFQE